MLRIFSAGVAGRLAASTAAAWDAAHPALPCELTRGGSVDGVRKLLSGERFDVLILADHENIEQMLMPRYADGYYIWGGNEMVLLGDGITAENWQEVLLRPESEIRHFDPYGDPGGYRAVLSMRLADRVTPGLSEKLFHHPRYRGLDRAQYQAPMGDPTRCAPEKNVYRFLYRSAAVASGHAFAALPAVMNLGDPAYADAYRSVSFDVDAHTTVRGNVIRHAVCIPLGAEHKPEAVDFVRQFLKMLFPAYGFTSVQSAIGNWAENGI